MAIPINKPEATKAGTLYIVATPIGHRHDISFRAVEILKTVDVIAAEDTRHSLQLLRVHGVHTPLKALHAFNEHKHVSFFIEKLQQGANVALISDAGTPLIQDPGYVLIQHAIAADIPVSPIPGPCAAIAALCVSGAPTHRFTFIGFLPTQKKARQTELQHLSQHPYTLIFYEAPHRILQFLEELDQHFGKKRMISVGRELTKIHESVYHGTPNELLQHFVQHTKQQQGEFVVVVFPAATVGAQHDEEANNENETIDAILKPLLKTRALSDAVKITVEITALNKNAIYNRALYLRDEIRPA